MWLKWNQILKKLEDQLEGDQVEEVKYLAESKLGLVKKNGVVETTGAISG
jgi:hypothetical protein